jgi:hypothetical protein
MAGSATRSFASPAGASPHMKGGHGPKYRTPGKRELSDSVDPLALASSTIPSFKSRHAKTNNKHGFNTSPARPPSGRLAQRAGKPNRGSGKEHRSLL